MKIKTIETFMTTITALTIADSCVPLISIKVMMVRINNAGVLIIPCTPVADISIGEWHHSYGIDPPIKLFKYWLQEIATVAAPKAYSNTNDQPIAQATISPNVAYA